MRKLPPLSALRAFEAAARNGSFKHAAGELFVTPTAISHQVRQLEEILGQKLFHRRTRKVELTETARQLQPVLSHAFDDIAAIVEAVQSNEARRVVTLTTTMAIAARWLIPRITEFGRDNPDVRLRLIASEELMDLARGDADIAIRYGTGGADGCMTSELTALRFAPVCSPALDVRSPEDLDRVPLVCFAWKNSRADNPTWDRWLASEGINRKAIAGDRHFSDETHAIDATLAGQGVALLALPLVREEIERGQLVAPFGPELSGASLSLAVSKRRMEVEEVSVVHEWLLRAATSGPAALV